jgi:hypothetical protein
MYYLGRPLQMLGFVELAKPRQGLTAKRKKGKRELEKQNMAWAFQSAGLPERDPMTWCYMHELQGRRVRVSDRTEIFAGQLTNTRFLPAPISEFRVIN